MTASTILLLVCGVCLMLPPPASMLAIVVIVRGIFSSVTLLQRVPQCCCASPAYSAVWTLGLGLENESPQIELFQSEPSSSHNIMTFYSSIGQKIKS